MLYRAMADAVLILHLAFALFALLGGVLVLRYPRMLGVHLPVLIWGIVVEWADWTCPLTPLENALRRLGGEAGYAGGFIEHLLFPALYPENLTLEMRYALGFALVAVNVGIYGYAIFNKRGRIA
ncbi:MAG: hypothetical protein V7642_2410 [Burkholderiales bacterium]|jgi:hypothetical protein